METHQLPSVNKDNSASESTKTPNIGIGEIFSGEFSLPDFIAKMCLFQVDAEAAHQQSGVFDAKSDAGNSATSDIAWLTESELDRVDSSQDFISSFLICLIQIP
jgi:hypothetical protein